MGQNRAGERRIMPELMQWFAMGGYAGYVWPAYGLVVGLLLLNGISCRWQRKRIKKSIQIWIKHTS